MSNSLNSANFFKDNSLVWISKENKASERNNSRKSYIFIETSISSTNPKNSQPSINTSSPTHKATSSIPSSSQAFTSSKNNNKSNSYPSSQNKNSSLHQSLRTYNKTNKLAQKSQYSSGQPISLKKSASPTLTSSTKAKYPTSPSVSQKKFITPMPTLTSSSIKK